METQRFCKGCTTYVKIRSGYVENKVGYHEAAETVCAENFTLNREIGARLWCSLKAPGPVKVLGMKDESTVEKMLPHFIDVDIPSDTEPVSFGLVEAVGHFSYVVDEHDNRSYVQDKTNYREVTMPEFPMFLNHGFSSEIPVIREGVRSPALRGLDTFLSSTEGRKILDDVTFVVSRGVLKRIATVAVHPSYNDGWKFSANRLKDYIRIEACDVEIVQPAAGKWFCLGPSRFVTSKFYQLKKFEEMVQSQSRIHIWEEPQFHRLFKTKVGNNTLLYNANIDGYRVTKDGKEDVEFRLMNKFNNGVDYGRLSTTYVHAYLANVKTVIYVYREEDGIATKMNEMKLSEVPELIGKNSSHKVDYFSTYLS